MGKFPLWCCGIVDLIEAGVGMLIEANNQLSEALVKSAKHNQGACKRVSDPGDCVVHRCEGSDKCTKQLIHQHETAHGKIHELLSHRAKRQRDAETNNVSASSRAVLETGVGLTQDELAQQDQQECTEQWGRGSKGGSCLEIEARLWQEVADKLHKPIGEASYSKCHELLEDCIGSKHISLPVLRELMANTLKSSRGLGTRHFDTLQELVDHHWTTLGDAANDQSVPSGSDDLES